MGTFSIKCPECGIDLVAEEQYIGCKVACASCEHRFILRKATPIVLMPAIPKFPDKLEDIKIGVLALNGLKIAFKKHRFDDQILNDLQTVKRTKAIFKFKWPLLVKRDAATLPRPLIDGYHRHWKNPVLIRGQEYFLCSQWFEYHRIRLIEYLQSFGVTYAELRNVCQQDHDTISIAAVASRENKMDSLANFEDSFSFNAPKANLSFTKPHLVMIDKVEKKVDSWRYVLLAVATMFYERHTSKILSLRGKAIPRFTKRICLTASSDCEGLCDPRKIADNLWIETNLSATAIVKLSVALAAFCGVDLTTIRVFYTSNRLEKKEVSTAVESGSGGKNTEVDSEVGKRLTELLKAHFQHGYRISSNIDSTRFEKYYASKYGEEFTGGSNVLNALVKSIAVVFDDRAYAYDEETIKSVRIYLEQMNSPCIHIITFFEKFSGELYAFGVFSVDMLKAFIEKNYVDVFCKRDYVYLQADISPTDLIRQVFNEREIWSIGELFDRLPCIKQDTIRATLNSSNYLCIETGRYTHLDNMYLPDSEGEKIVAFVNDQLQSKDYVIANELDLSQFEALNPHCPFSAIRDAVFYKFLSDRYCKSGQVITCIGKKLRVLDILEQYCREIETASFEELNSFEATFDQEGRTHSQCLIAAHNAMVRVSGDLFVADSNVNFDVKKTDEAIALYCRDNFISLKTVVDFSLFPYAGYPWNLFLLESYIRKFSILFKYDVRAVNSANIGVIVRKSFTYDEYDDILAIALSKSPISLDNKKGIGDYLFDNGYIGWRNLGKSEEKVLAAAKILREGGVV